RLLIANRGEIAVRSARAAAELANPCVAIYFEDDAGSLHLRKADQDVLQRCRCASAYLDITLMVEQAREMGCNAIHPGYGFLSESAELARACAEAGITFIGPDARVLELFGDKAQARQLAQREGVPVVQGTEQATTLEQAQAFIKALPEGTPVLLK